MVDSIVVHWPSTLVQTLTGVAGDQRLLIVESGVSATPGPRAAARAELLPPSPNPTRGAIALHLELPAEQRVRLAILDVSGRRVRLLADRTMPAGRHDLRWDGLDAFGRAAPAGV